MICIRHTANEKTELTGNDVQGHTERSGTDMRLSALLPC